MQTLTAPFGVIRDVEYLQAWARYLTIKSDNSCMCVALTDFSYDVESDWQDLYDRRSEMLVGITVGANESEALHRALEYVAPGETRPIRSTDALRKALGVYAEPVRQALDVACLYRGKPRMVMWPHTGVDKPNRLRAVARAWDFLPDYEAGDVPVYRRNVNMTGTISDTSAAPQ